MYHILHHIGATGGQRAACAFSSRPYRVVCPILGQLGTCHLTGVMYVLDLAVCAVCQWPRFWGQRARERALCLQRVYGFSTSPSVPPQSVSAHVLSLLRHGFALDGFPVLA